MKHWLVRIVAIAVFGVSFALPAVRVGSSGSGGAHPMAGWMCAAFASVVAVRAFFAAAGQGLNRDAILLPMSGLVNYFFLLILVLGIWRRLVWIRMVLGALMLACFAATWAFFSANQLAPLYGHYLWVTGAILLLVPDVWMVLSRRTQAPPNPSEIGVPVSTNRASGA
jgi:hypothetical protein